MWPSFLIIFTFLTWIWTMFGWTVEAIQINNWFHLYYGLTSTAGQMAINFMAIAFEWFHMARQGEPISRVVTTNWLRINQFPIFKNYFHVSCVGRSLYGDENDFSFLGRTGKTEIVQSTYQFTSNDFNGVFHVLIILVNNKKLS